MKRSLVASIAIIVLGVALCLKAITFEQFMVPVGSIIAAFGTIWTVEHAKANGNGTTPPQT